MRFIDLHSHVLFGIDDGAPTLAESLAMLDALAKLGIVEQCVTPHQKAGQYLPTRPQIDSALAAVEAARQAHHPVLRLGAENMWDDVFLASLHGGALSGYAASSAFLLELPLAALPLGVEQTLFGLRIKGRVPVLAHPERYGYLSTAALRTIAQNAALVIDLPALAGFHGKREQKVARQLIDQGLVHAVATDAHCVQDVRNAEEGLLWLSKHAPTSHIQAWFVDNPARILAGQLPDPVP